MGIHGASNLGAAIWGPPFFWSRLGGGNSLDGKEIRQYPLLYVSS